MTDKPKKKIWSRRDFLMQSGGGMAGLALASLMTVSYTHLTLPTKA